MTWALGQILIGNIMLKTNISRKVILQTHWVLVLFFSQGTLIRKERERGELFLKKQFLGYFQSHKCFCYFRQQQNEEAHSMGRRCSSTETAPSLRAVAPRKANECFIGRHCLPPAKAGQAGQALSKCWKMWSYVKKRSKKHIWTLFQWLDLPCGEASDSSQQNPPLHSWDAPAFSTDVLFPKETEPWQ